MTVGRIHLLEAVAGPPLPEAGHTSLPRGPPRNTAVCLTKQREDTPSALNLLQGSPRRSCQRAHLTGSAPPPQRDLPSHHVNVNRSETSITSPEPSLPWNSP